MTRECLTISRNGNSEWVIEENDQAYKVHLDVLGNGWRVSRGKHLEVTFTSYGKEYLVMCGADGQEILAIVNSDGSMASTVVLASGSPVTKLFRKTGEGNNGLIESIPIDVAFDRQRY